MKQLKKATVSLIMAVLLLVTAIPTTTVNVQAASVGRVTGLKAVFTKGSVKLTWKRASGAKKYEVYCSRNGRSYTKVKTVSSISWKDTRKGELWYKVRAVNGNRRGSFSNVASVYTLGGRITVRMQGNSFISAGNSVFVIQLWNYGNQKPAFIGCTNNGRTMTNFPVFVYNKKRKRYEKSLTNASYYPGALSTASGETNIKTSYLHNGKGKYLIYVSGLGMIAPYVNAYDNGSVYTYYINTYFKVGTRKYRLRVSSNPSAYKDYQVQRAG